MIVQGITLGVGLAMEGPADPSTYAGGAASSHAVAIRNDGGGACVCECKTVPWHSAATAVTGQG